MSPATTDIFRFNNSAEFLMKKTLFIFSLRFVRVLWL